MTLFEIVFCLIACLIEKILIVLSKRYEWQKNRREKLTASANVMERHVQTATQQMKKHMSRQTDTRTDRQKHGVEMGNRHEAYQVDECETVDHEV